MALHGELRINGVVIGVWEAQRQKPHGQPEPDDLCIYQCTVNQNSAPDGCPALYERFSIEHRFGDGATALAGEVLRKAATLHQMKGQFA